MRTNAIDMGRAPRKPYEYYTVEMAHSGAFYHYFAIHTEVQYNAEVGGPKQR